MIAVDIQLIAAADISDSVTPNIGKLQRDGYAKALRSTEIARAIQQGPNGRIGFAYIEWGDVGRINIIVPWTIIDSETTARAVAKQLESAPENRLLKTSITHALRFSGDYFDQSNMSGDKVIDLSGNGPNNQGPGLAQVRDQLVLEGVTINGLPIMADITQPRGVFGTGFDLRELDRYFENCVIAGANSFVLPVRKNTDIMQSIQLKMLREISERTLRPRPRVFKAQFRPAPDREYRC